jgi:hypothetical protein
VKELFFDVVLYRDAQLANSHFEITSVPKRLSVAESNFFNWLLS